MLGSLKTAAVEAVKTPRCHCAGKQSDQSLQIAASFPLLAMTNRNFSQPLAKAPFLGEPRSRTVSAARIVELAYAPDTPRRFEALNAGPWSVMLDSGHPGTQQGRYDILAAEPYATLTTRGPLTEIRSGGSAELSERDPLELLTQCLGPSAESVPGVPFAGGAIGYFGYDLGRRFEELPSFAERDIDLPDMAVGFYDWALITDHRLRKTYLVAQGRCPATFERWNELVDRVQATSSPRPRSFEVCSAVGSNLDRASYGRAFDRIQHYIREGDCYQVNLAQRFSIRTKGDPWDAYLQLRELNPAPYSAFMSITEGSILSTSPERFLQIRDGAVETRPIKGTRPRSFSKERDRALALELRESAKDRAENVMIVDLLRNDLGKNCAPGSIAVPRLFEVESFASVHHLVSTVTGRLAANRHPLDLLRGCFPGGSITGAPKVRAMEIIEELEPHRRSVYCGSLGYVGFDGSMDCSIAIRTLVAHAGSLHAWAGGGIVADSQVEAEYQESLDKAEAALKLMAIERVSRVGS